MNNPWFHIRLLALFMALMLTGQSSVYAAAQNSAAAQTDSENTSETTETVYKWKKDSKGFYNCYINGKKATYLQTIDGKKYYFNKKGRQLTGWQLINKSYYYFLIKNGKNGYMVTSKTVNGIKLGKNGKAVLNNKTKKRKVKLLYNAQLKVREIITDNTLSKKKKLKKVYDWTQKSSNIRKSNIGGFKRSDSNWDMTYAERILSVKSLPNKGDCYTYASTFGYLANALGYEVIICSTGGHGYVKIGNQFYDPSWQKAVSRSLFAMSYNTYCPELGFTYYKNMKYTKTV